MTLVAKMESFLCLRRPAVGRIAAIQKPGTSFSYGSSTAYVRHSMPTDALSRRGIFMGAVSLGASPKSEPEPIYLFATAQYRIRMTLEFHDNYGEFGLGFRERSSGRPFCLSFQGEEDRNCVGNFIGSVAVARYKILTPNTSEPSMSLREYVRNIDHSDSIATRPLSNELFNCSTVLRAISRSLDIRNRLLAMAPRMQALMIKLGVCYARTCIWRTRQTRSWSCIGNIH
jgi:hypothetical protein